MYRRITAFIILITFNFACELSASDKVEFDISTYVGPSLTVADAINCLNVIKTEHEQMAPVFKWAWWFADENRAPCDWLVLLYPCVWVDYINDWIDIRHFESRWDEIQTAISLLKNHPNPNVRLPEDELLNIVTILFKFRDNQKQMDAVNLLLNNLDPSQALTIQAFKQADPIIVNPNDTHVVEPGVRDPLAAVSI